MLELVCVMALVGILSVIAIPKFMDARDEGRAAAVQQNLATLRSGLKNQAHQANLRCGADPTRWTGGSDENGNPFTFYKAFGLVAYANDITSGTECIECSTEPDPEYAAKCSYQLEECNGCKPQACDINPKCTDQYNECSAGATNSLNECNGCVPEVCENSDPKCSQQFQECIDSCPTLNSCNGCEPDPSCVISEKCSNEWPAEKCGGDPNCLAKRGAWIESCSGCQPCYQEPKCATEVANCQSKCSSQQNECNGCRDCIQKPECTVQYNDLLSACAAQQTECNNCPAECVQNPKCTAQYEDCRASAPLVKVDPNCLWCADRPPPAGICSTSQVKNSGDRAFWNFPDSQAAHDYVGGVDYGPAGHFPTNPLSTSGDLPVMKSLCTTNNKILQKHGGNVCNMVRKEFNSQQIGCHWVYNEDNGEIYPGSYNSKFSECNY